MAGLHTPTAINVMTLESFQNKVTLFSQTMHDWFPFIYDEDAPRTLLDSIQNSSCPQFRLIKPNRFYCPDIYFLSQNFSELSGDKLTLHAVR